MKWKWFIPLIPILIIAFLFSRSEKPSETEIPVGAINSTKFDFNGKIINTNYTDENIGEDLIIRTDQETYGGWDKFISYFSVENQSIKDQNVEIRFFFDGSSSVVNIESFEKDISKIKTINLYEDLPSKCLDGSDNCTIQRIIGSEEVIYVSDEWKSESIIDASKESPIKAIKENYTSDKEFSVFIPAGEMKFFKATIDIPNTWKMRKEWYIEAKGDQGGKGMLDPWFDTNFTYCRKMTMTAGGESGGVATTTTIGFQLAATTTLSTLAATSSSGRIQILTNYSSATSTPIDLIFTSGTDCNSDGGSLLDFYIESYASTTGAINAWLQSTDISSTTSKIVLMYYGNTSATDQSNKAGVWDTNKIFSKWDLDENPTTVAPQILDATANNKDGAASNFTVANSITGNIGRGLQYVDFNDIVTVSSFTMPTAYTKMVWVNISNAGSSNNLISDNGSHAFWTGGNTYFQTGHNGTYTSVNDNAFGEITTSHWYQSIVTYDGSSILSI